MRLMIQSLARVVRQADSTIHRTRRNYYLADSVVCFVNAYPLDSDLSGDSVIQLLNDWGQAPEARNDTDPTKSKSVWKMQWGPNVSSFHNESAKFQVRWVTNFINLTENKGNLTQKSNRIEIVIHVFSWRQQVKGSTQTKLCLFHHQTTYGWRLFNFKSIFRNQQRIKT